MHISIDTANEISDLDRQILTLLAGGGVSLPVEGNFVSEVKDEAPRNTERKTTAKKSKPKPEPEPEPIAEDPIEEDGEDEEESENPEDELDAEDLLELATRKATEMVENGSAAKVREALDAAGASRVRELNSENVREFFRALS